MAVRGRDVVAAYVLGSGPVGDPPAFRNVDPKLREYQSRFAFLRGAGALLAGVPQIGNPTAGGTGPDWPAAGPPAPAPAPVAGAPATADATGDCCG